MAFSSSNLIGKVIRDIANVAPNKYQKLKEDGRKNAEFRAMINQVISENLTVTSLLQEKLQSASPSYIPMVLAETYRHDLIETIHGFEAENFRLPIAQTGGSCSITTTRNETDIKASAGVDWAFWIQCVSILIDIGSFLSTCVGIVQSISERYIADMTERVAEMIRQSAFRRAFDALVETWNRTDSKYERAKAIYQFLKDSYSKDILWKIIKLIFLSLSLSEWMYTAAQLAVILVAAFATDGLALIARIVLALDAAKNLSEKIRNVI